MQDSPDAKKPCKGILKNSSSFDKPGASYRKSAKFDELNVLQTYHPHDKDYGHMKIDEPKTPFNYVIPDLEHQDQLDANLLAEKLRIAANTQSPSFDADDNLSDEDFPESTEEKVRRIEFERRRKAHYNEFEAVKMARKLIEEELADEEEDELTLNEDSLQTKSDTDFQGSEENQTGTDGEALEEESVKHSEDIVSSNNPDMDVDSLDPAHPCHGRLNQ